VTDEDHEALVTIFDFGVLEAKPWDRFEARVIESRDFLGSRKELRVKYQHRIQLREFRATPVPFRLFIFLVVGTVELMSDVCSILVKMVALPIYISPFSQEVGHFFRPCHRKDAGNLSVRYVNAVCAADHKTGKSSVSVHITVLLRFSGRRCGATWCFLHFIRGGVVWARLPDCPQPSPPPPPRPLRLLPRLAGSRAPHVARAPPFSAGCLVIHHIAPSAAMAS
jgi:hypothetical protein